MYCTLCRQNFTDAATQTKNFQELSRTKKPPSSKQTSTSSEKFCCICFFLGPLLLVDVGLQDVMWMARRHMGLTQISLIFWAKCKEEFCMYCRNNDMVTKVLCHQQTVTTGIGCSVSSSERTCFFCVVTISWQHHGGTTKLHGSHHVDNAQAKGFG